MKTNKEEIIDELMLLEPELKNDRKKIETLFDSIIDLKPNVNISSKFKKELKEKLLYKIEKKWNLYMKSKYNSLKIIFSFIFWWITTFSLIGLFWINLDLLNINNDKNTDLIWIEIFEWNNWMMLKNTRAAPMAMWIMNIEEDVDLNDSNKELVIELKKYLVKLWLSEVVISQILEIIKKYK